jgi:hypothetical protein
MRIICSARWPLATLTTATSLATHYPPTTKLTTKKKKQWHAAPHRPIQDPRTTHPRIWRAPAAAPTAARSSTRTRARGRASCARRCSRRTSSPGTLISSLAWACSLLGLLLCGVGGSCSCLCEGRKEGRKGGMECAGRASHCIMQLVGWQVMHACMYCWIFGLAGLANRTA